MAAAVRGGKESRPMTALMKRVQVVMGRRIMDIPRARRFSTVTT